jgi:hypothetical protein
VPTGQFVDTGRWLGPTSAGSGATSQSIDEIAEKLAPRSGTTVVHFASLFATHDFSPQALACTSSAGLIGAVAQASGKPPSLSTQR